MKLFILTSFFILNIILISGLFYDISSQSAINSPIKIINNSEFKKILDEQNENAVLINVWATWCVPCREEFPSLVRLYENYKSKIKFIGISADDVDDLDSKVIPFLESQNAPFENYLINVREPENFINALNKEWSGALPATFIYNENGEQVSVLLGKQTYEEFEQEIKKVIN